MKRLLPILFLFSLAYGQTTPLSFTKLGSTTDVITPARGAEQWISSPWDNVNDPYIPAGNAVPTNWYYRFLWGADIETGAQGVYVFTKFDAQIHAAMDNGQLFDFAVMPMCGGCGYNAGGISGLSYPAYLHTLMQAESTNSKDWFYTAGGEWVPNCNSPNYQARLKALYVAIANHIATTSYKGIPYANVIGYFDIRGYGETGEWNTYPWYGTEPTGRTATAASLDSIISTSGTAFPNNLFVGSFGALDPGNASLIPPATSTYWLAYTNTYGHIGWRRDNIGDPGWDAAEDGNAGILTQWSVATCGGEPNNDATDAPYGDVPREVTKYGMTYFGNGNWSSVNPSNPTFVANAISASLNSGYRLVLNGGSYTTSPVSNGTFTVALAVRNIGVAPLYRNYYWRYQLRNGSGTVIWTGTSSFRPRLFLPSGSDNNISDNFTLTGVAAGTYSLRLIIQDSTGYTIPLGLAITGRQTDGSYILAASVTVTNSGGSPVAYAGPNQAITFPSSSVTLDGTGSSGTWSTQNWTQLSGPNTAVIGTPTTITTTASGLIPGVYVFQLSLNSGATTSTVQITVNPAIPPGTNVFTTQTPSGGTMNDGGGGIEVGMKFQSSSPGYITGARFYKTSGLTGTHIGELYSYPAGTRLAQATFTGETATGWQYVTFSTPISISINTTYVIAMYGSLGNYVDDNAGTGNTSFATAITNAPLTGLVEGGSSGHNGVYALPVGTPTYPTSFCGGCGGANYWIDVLYSPVLPNVCNCHPRTTSGFTQVIPH